MYKIVKDYLNVNDIDMTVEELKTYIANSIKEDFRKVIITEGIISSIKNSGDKLAKMREKLSQLNFRMVELENKLVTFIIVAFDDNGINLDEIELDGEVELLGELEQLTEEVLHECYIKVMNEIY